MHEQLGGNWSSDSTWSTTSGGGADTTKPTSSDDVVFDNLSGNVTVDAASVAKSLTFAGGTGYTGTLTHNAFTLTVSGSITFVSTMTYTPLSTSTVVMAATGTLTTGTKLMPLVKNTSGTMTLGDNLSFMASQVMTLTISGTAVDLNGRTVSGNSNINRLLIQSGTVGTGATITVSSGTFAYVDFQDITFANGGNNLDLSGITGNSGNCGGNTISGGGTLTFTSTTTQTFASTTGSWSNVAKWTSRIPLPQDLARFQAMSAGQTITIDMPRLPDTDFSSVTNTPTVLMNVSGLDHSFYGSVNLTGIGTFTATRNYNFRSRADATITSNGKAFTSGVGSGSIYMPGATLTFNDAFSTPGNFYFYNGTLTTNHDVSVGYFNNRSGTTTNMGSGTWTISNYYGWSVSADTINCGTSTIALTYTGATATPFSGSTNTYNNFTIASGSGILTFSGAFTFSNMTMSSVGTRTIKFTKNTTYTMTGTNFLSGTSGNLITINSDDGSTSFSLVKTGAGPISSDFLKIDRSSASPAYTWYAGGNSIDDGHNSGWTFTAPTVPDPPTIGTAGRGNAKAIVYFTAPLNNGGYPITSYTVTSTPGGHTATGASSPITVSGLTNGTSYTFTVHATNLVGNSSESAASIAVTPANIPEGRYPVKWT